MNAKRSLSVPLVLAVAAIPLVGCSGNGLNLAKVSGKVTWKGQPVKNGTVFFMPDESKGTKGMPAMAAIADNGSYTLSTETTGDGVIVGSHLVGITGLEPNPVSETVVADAEKDPDAYIKVKARDAAIARGEVRGPDDKKLGDTFTDRGGRRFRFVTPKKLSNPQDSGIIVKVDRARTVNFDVDENGQVHINP